MLGYFIARWKDNRLGFAPSAAWDKYHSYSPGDVWCPHFDFVNGIVPHSTYDVSICAYPDGTVKYMKRSSAELSNTFRLKTFPFDWQKLEIPIHPSMSDAESFDFIDLNGGRSLSAEPRVYSAAGRLSRCKSCSGARSKSRSGPARSFRRRVRDPLDRGSHPGQRPLRQLRVIMVILSWAVFWLDPSELSAQVTISVTTILTVIAFAFAI